MPRPRPPRPSTRTATPTPTAAACRCGSRSRSPSCAARSPRCSRASTDSSRTRIDDPYTAAAISFGSGLAILLVVLAAWRPGRRGLGRVRRRRSASGRLAWWMVLGGLAGAWFVTTQGLSAGRRRRRALHGGDRRGPDARRHRLRPRRTRAGRASAAHAHARDRRACSRSPRSGGRCRRRSRTTCRSCSCCCRSRRASAPRGSRPSTAGSAAPPTSALTATVVNFAVGTTALVVVMLVHAASAGWPSSMPTEPWLYVGGAIGCIFIAGQAVLVRIIGVLVLAPLRRRRPAHRRALARPAAADRRPRRSTLATIGGTVLALVAVVIASVGWTRRRTRSAGAAHGRCRGSRVRASTVGEQRA